MFERFFFFKFTPIPTPTPIPIPIPIPIPTPNPTPTPNPMQSGFLEADGLKTPVGKDFKILERISRRI